MDRPLLLPLAICTQPSLVGGKALGLARLLAGGFPVPSGFCVTTEAYDHALRAPGFSPAEQWQAALHSSGAERHRILSHCRAIILNYDIAELTAQIVEQVQQMDLPLLGLWAVRSSATNEDGVHASFAGVYCTRLGIPLEEMGLAVKDLWLSIWDERVLNYHATSGLSELPPAMAVVIQPLLEAQASGVAYSIHPLTGRATQVAINVVAGLAAALVDGRATPDQYVVEMAENSHPSRVRERMISGQTQALRVTDQGLREVPLSDDAVGLATLSDDQLFALARTAKQIEKTFGHPVDLEWLYDERGLWLLQARPISGLTRSPQLTNDDCEWSRANFKETLPELPSPLGLSFLELFMERYILSPYRRLGCRIPEGISSVRTFQGRPYINMTLFHSLIVQLRGDPSLLAEQMGGEIISRVPEVHPLGWFALARAGVAMMAEMRKAVRHGPAWFAEMKAMAAEHRADRLQTVSGEDIARRLDAIAKWLDKRELTFGIAGGVSQCLQALGGLLPRWLGGDWRALLNGALQGQAAVISAQQIVRLAEVADMVRHDPEAVSWFTAEGWDPVEFRRRLEGTDVLRAFDRYLEDYGHRGVGESDVMSPRFADRPELLLAVLRTQILAPTSVTPSDILQRQTVIRERALAEIRARFGWRFHRWAIFSWWYRRLCRFFALREANRHHLMYYSAATRNLLLRLGEWLVERGRLSSQEDIFYLTIEARADLLAGGSSDWRGLIQARRAERDRYLMISVPDTIRDWNDVVRDRDAFPVVASEGIFHGIPISAGQAVGPVRFVRSMEDWSRVCRGDILVVSVIDPGIAPLFGVAAGLVAEMGGTLSHGAIIAREYGLPAVANVPGITTRLKEGDRISLDAERGEIILQERGGDLLAGLEPPNKS
ncbi:MAG: PEP/pyruvate-binding domain-containing protein [Nitrospirota bacterium]|nr:PEP/pyruvate-binding domain-containing protein [Nitrospirota bacterium]